MTTRQLFTRSAAFAASSFALLFGCGVEPELGDENESRGVADESDQEIATSGEALTACVTALHHGGNLWEQDYEVIMGCDCGTGFIRDFRKVWNNGHGSCNAVGWASPDQTDCRVRVHIHDSGGFFYGDCNVQVEKKLIASSCDGHCGGAASGGGCFCDAACTGLGDCCSDKVRECNPANSCLNRCGGAATGCFCDSACTGFGDCCSDFAALCPLAEG